jgi:hypothetical protein
MHRIWKFCSEKNCAPMLALISNHPGLCISFYDETLGILLNAINRLWISWKFGLIWCIRLKFLPKVSLTRITHSWKFQPKRTILSSKSVVGRKELNFYWNELYWFDRKIWLIMWNNKPVLVIGIVLFIFVTVAIMVVLSLIPLYVATKDVTRNKSNAGINNLYITRHFYLFFSYLFTCLWK